MPDMLFHNRRVAKKIVALLDRLEIIDPPQPRAISARPQHARREQTSTILTAKGRAVRVVRKVPGQLEMRL